MSYLSKTVFLAGALLIIVNLEAIAAQMDGLSIGTLAPKSTLIEHQASMNDSPVKISFTEEQNSVVRFSCTPWMNLQPILSRMIEDTARDPKFEERQFCFQVDREAWTTYYEWSSALFQKYRYPIGISTRNARCEGDRVNGIYQIYYIEVTVHNHTKKEEFVREGGKYKFFGGELDATLVDERTFYNLMVRAGFSEDDFKDGQTGLQGRVSVKPVKLKCVSLEECYEEVREMLLPALQKAVEQYITFVFNLSTEAKFTITDLITYNKGAIGNLFHELNNLGTIYEPTEKRMYLIFANDRRQKLDLHGFEEDGKLNGITQAGALKLVRDYIEEQYNNFGDECIILTGKGKHENSSGVRGVLHAAFKTWMKDEKIKPLIRNYHPYGEGGFRVILRKPIVCDLAMIIPPSDPGAVVIKQLKQAFATGEDRILVKSADSSFEQQLMRSIVVDRSFFMQGSPTISFYSSPGEFRITLRKDRELLTLVVDRKNLHKGGQIHQQAPDQQSDQRLLDTKKESEQPSSTRANVNRKPESPTAVAKQQPKSGQAEQKVKASPAANYSKPTAKSPAKPKKNKKPAEVRVGNKAAPKQQGTPKHEK